jgi:hypothetical protein
MGRRALPPLLAAVILLSDVAGAHGLALMTLFAAIPAAFVYVLDCYGDAIAARCGGVRPLLAAASLFLLVLSAALRSPAVVGGVPRLAVSAVGMCLLVYGIGAAGALVPARARTVPRLRRAAPASGEDERLAA